MKQIEAKILIAISIFSFSSFLSCNNESTTNNPVKGSDTLSLAIAVGDSFKYAGFDAAKWMSLSDEISNENSFGYADRGERLEKRITKKLENIDPAEYYLSDSAHVKFTNKKEMNELKKKLLRLNRIYRNNYYENGHVLERRNNMLILSTLNQKNTASGKRLSEMPGEYAHNANIALLKSGNKNHPITSMDDLKTFMNNAVQLLNIAQLSEQSEKLTLLSDAEQSLNILQKDKRFCDDYLLNYNKAFIRYSYSDYSEAIMYGKKSIAAQKSFYLSYILLGDSYFSQGNIDTAYTYYVAAQKIKNNIVTLERVAYTALFLGKGGIAEDCYSQILNKQDYHKNDRQNYKVGYALALAYNGKHELSMGVAKDLRVWRPNWAITWLIEGWNELMLGKYDLAEKDFKKSISKGDVLCSEIGIAFSKFCMKDYLSSAKIFYDLDNTPEYQTISSYSSLLLYSGYSFANTHDYSGAFNKFNSYGNLNEKDNYYYLGMSLCYLGYGAYHFAKQNLDSVGKQTNNSSDYYYLQGICKLRNDEFQEAKSFFEKALNFDRKNLRYINGLGASLTALEKFDKSISVFDEGLKLKPEDKYLLFNKADAIFSIGKNLFVNGSVQLAKDTIKYGFKLIDRVISIDPSWSESCYLNIGNTYLVFKDSINALAYYKKATPIAADVNIGTLYANFERIDKAKQIWQQVLEVDSTVDLATYNIKAIDLPLDSYKTRKHKNQERFKCYYVYHYDLKYHINYPFPVLFGKYSEPLPPLGYANLKFAKITNGESK